MKKDVMRFYGLRYQAKAMENAMVAREQDVFGQSMQKT
jgi:hypothetical protein